MSLLTKVKTLLGKTQDNEGWIRQGKLSVGKNLRDMADSLSDNKVFGATKQVLSQGINNAFNPYAKMAEGRSLSALTPNKKVEYSPFVKIGSDVVNQGLKNYLAGSTFNLIQPKMGEAQTTAGKVSGGISNLVGAFSSPLKKVVWDLPEKGATEVTRKILQNTAPKLAGSTFSRFLPQFNSEVAQTLGYATLSKIGNKLGVNDRTDQFTPKGLTTDLAMGLGFRYAPQLVQNLMGINSKGIMHPEDVTWMDSAIDTLRNKKATPKQVQNAKTILYRLGENYLDKSKLNEGANASLLAKQLQKVAGNQVGGGTVPTMGIVDKSQPLESGVIPEVGGKVEIKQSNSGNIYLKKDGQYIQIPKTIQNDIYRTSYNGERLGFDRFSKTNTFLNKNGLEMTPDGKINVLSQSPSIPEVKQPTIKIKAEPGVKISGEKAKPSKLQLSGQSQTPVKQSLDQQRISLDTQTGQLKNSVPSAVAEGTPSKVSQPIIPQKKYLESVNTNKLKLKPEEKKTLETATSIVKDEIQKVKGKTLSNDEVIQAAKQSDILQNVVTREQTLQAEASLLKARQQMVSLDKEVNELSKQGNSPLLQKKIGELLESIKTVNANAADRGRQLQALSVDAGDESVRMAILKDISKVETDSEKIIRESANVDWNNANKVAEFYRKFIKPSTMEILDEYRYNNMLSSPRTHIRNAFSNVVQTFVTRPVTLAAQGKFKETGQYYKGVISSIPDAVNDFAKAFKGETAIGQQDIKNIPSGKIPKFMTIPSKALEASDRFFTKLISGGELARGASETEALDTAAYSLFRQGLKPEGQGKLLNAIDSLTSWTYNAPKAVRWFVPFIRTPMNFAKQWVEYSPAGALTTIGAKNKGEQLAKAFVGSTIMAVGAKFALDNNTTWSAPIDPKEKEIFYASGRKPFSVKIGNKWVSMMYAGPFALAFAVPAAAKYYQEDNRTALTDSQLEKLGRISMSMAEYLSGQTFLEGMNNFVKFFSGDADYTFAKNMGYTAGQVIPLQGLVRWVSSIIDPVYRKATTFGDQIKSGIPGVSKTLPAYLDPTGQPSTRESYNAFTPYDITPDKPQYKKPLEERQNKLQQNAVINKTVKEMEAQLQSGTDPTPVQVGNIFIIPEEGEIKKIELKQFSLPEKTGDVEKDKKALSSYKSSITAQIKQVERLVATKALPEGQGKELISNLYNLKNSAPSTSSTSGKKSTKSKGGKIAIKKNTIKLSKLPTFKAPSFAKTTTSKKPSLKLSQPKKIVIQPSKLKSNTIKISRIPTMKVAKGGFLG